MTTRLRLSGLPIALLVTLGCATRTAIDFESPRGSQLRLREKSYVFPCAVRLPQRTAPLLANNGYAIEIEIADAKSPGGVLATRGVFYVYRTMLSDVDVLARNFFRIPEDKIGSLRDGAAVTIEGLSAEGGKLLYRAVLGLQKDETTVGPLTP
jgi:hypothetical protein